MGKLWRIPPHDAGLVSRLEREAGVPPVVAQLLVARGVFDPAAVREFLDVKFNDLRRPDALPGLAEAADRLLAAVRERRRVVIYGDYDADGMSGAAVLYLCLRDLSN